MLACTALDTTAEAEQSGWPALPASPISQNMFNILPHLANSSMLDKVISSEFIPKYHLKSSSINQKPKRQYSENIFLKNAMLDKDELMIQSIHSQEVEEKNSNLYFRKFCIENEIFAKLHKL